MAVTPLAPDPALSRRLQARDRGAWEELYAAYGPRLRAFALSLTRSAHEADDLVQETFVRALPRLDELGPETVNLGSYLFTTLRNVFLTSCERGKRVAPVEEVPEPERPAAIEDEPESSLLLRHQIEEVRVASESLAPRQRLALSLRELEDCSYAQIGEIVGLNENAVAQLISRARESLRVALRLAQVDTAAMPDACRDLVPLLSRLIDGQLRGDQLTRTTEHVAGCPHCAGALDSMREASRRYRVLVPPLPLAATAHAAAIDRELTSAGYWSGSRGRRALFSRRMAAVAVGALLVGTGGAMVVARTGDPPRGAAALQAEPTAAHSPAPAGTVPGVRPATEAGATQKRSAPALRARGRRRTKAATRHSAASPRSPRRAARRRERARERSRLGPASDTRRLGPGPAGAEAPPPEPDPAPAATDTTPPSAEITSASPAGDEVTFHFTASESGATFACSLDGAPFTGCSSPKTYPGLAAGSHTFHVRAIDSAGNTGAPDTHTWEVSRPLPDLVVSALDATGMTVHNTGTASAGPFVVTVTLVGSFTFRGLAAGEAARRSWSCRRGTLDAVADRNGDVAESDETNNRRTFSSTC